MSNKESWQEEFDKLYDRYAENDNDYYLKEYGQDLKSFISQLLGKAREEGIADARRYFKSAKEGDMATLIDEARQEGREEATADLIGMKAMKKIGILEERQRIEKIIDEMKKVNHTILGETDQEKVWNQALNSLKSKLNED